MKDWDYTSCGIAYHRSGEGEPVLLVMGLGMPGDTWEWQVEGLAQQHAVACFDHLGVGASKPLERRRRNMGQLAADAFAVMDACGWERAHVVGVSMGGMIAQHMALNSPERVRSLALLATSAGGRLAPLPKWQGVQRFLKVSSAKTPEARAEALLKLLFPASFLRESPAETLSTLRASYSRVTVPRTMRAHFLAVVSHNTAPVLSSLRCPTLILQPALDILINPRESKRLARLIPHATLLRYEDSGHGVVRQCPNRVNKDLLAHFAST